MLQSRLTLCPLLLSKIQNSSYDGRDNRRHDRGDRGYDRENYRRRRDDSPPRGRSYQRDKYGSRGNREYDSYSRRERSRDRYDDDRRNSMGRSDYRRNTASSDHPRDSNRSARFDDPHHHPSSQSMGQQRQQQGGYNASSAVPPPPPPRGTAQPPPHMAGLVGSFTPQQQQPYMQQQSQPQNQVFQNQYLPQSGVPGAYYSSSSAPTGVPGGFVASPAPASTPSGYVASSVPSGGISSALGSQGGTYNTTQQSFVAQTGLGQPPNLGNQLLQQQSNYLGSPAAPPIASSNNWQPQVQTTTDIIGLANRASAAVQALASQNALRASTAAPAAPQLGTNYYMNSGVSAAPAPSPARPGRSTATLDQLSTLVQFAVKNLQVGS